MRYVCLIYADECRLADLAGAERTVVERQCVAHQAELRGSGQLLAAEALQPASTATTLRMRGGSPSATAGPFAETKERLAGFYLIEARDLNDAIRVAARIPPARLGSVEVRPVRERAPGFVEP